MGHQLQTVVQGTVVLDVYQGILGVGDVQQRPGAIRVLTALIQFPLHTENRGPSPWKMGPGL